MSKKGIVLAAVAVLVLALALPALAQGVNVQDLNSLSGVQIGNGDSITLPVREFVGTVKYVSKSDLPRFELVGREVFSPGPYATGCLPPPTRYVLLVPGSIYKPVADAAKPNAKGIYPQVRVKGALVSISNGQRTMPWAIVVKYVEIVKPPAPMSK